MRYYSSSSDFYYDTTASTLNYYIAVNGETIYNGKAVKSPDRGKISVNVGKRVRDYVHINMPDFRDYDGVVVPHPEAMLVFSLYDTDSGNLLEEYEVRLDETKEWEGEEVRLSEPINTHADPRQKIFYGMTSFEPAVVYVETEDDVTDKIFFDSPFVFGWQSGTTTICYTSNTDFTLHSSSGDWFSVTQTKYDEYSGCLTFAYNENDGDFRLGFVYLGSEKGVQSFQVIQKKYEVEKYFRFTTSKGQTLPARETSMIISWSTNYDSVVYVFRGISATTSSSSTEVHFPANRNRALSVPYIFSAYTTGGTLLDTLDFTQNRCSGYEEQYLTLEFVSGGTLNWAGIIDNDDYNKLPYYSFDEGITWDRFQDFNQTFNVLPGDIMLMKGNMGTDRRVHTTSASTATFDVYGNAMSLYHYNFESTDSHTGWERLANFFSYSKVRSAENLVLPLTRFENTLTYYAMFYECTSLISAPALPAVTGMKGWDYDRMFYHCTSLREAPNLPSLACAGYSYNGMFQGCTSLVTPPVISATTLDENTCKGMFEGCTSLTTAPSLNATTLGGSCYENMFKNCTSLVTPPQLQATSLKMGCYENMFEGCTSLVTAPSLPSTSLASSCYSSMFKGCTSLVNPPILPATTLDLYCYSNMFEGCESLVTAPTLPASILVNNCYFYMFAGCISLISITCLATGRSGDHSDNALRKWVDGVYPTGTFTKSANATSFWTRGDNGIPSGWSVVDAS